MTEWNGGMMRRTGIAVALGLALRVGVLIGLGLVLGLGSAQAQNLFRQAITVNGSVITQYELNQRLEFLKILHQPGDLATLAHDGLIADRLQLDAARQLGVTASDDDIKAGMAEFAGRANLSVDDFLKAVAEGGVDPATFRDFVKAGIIWRVVLRNKFGGRIHISDAEVDRAIAGGAAAGGVRRLLLSEIVLQDDGKGDMASIAARIRDRVKSEADFALQAKLFSKVGTAGGGGELGWLDVTALPPAVAGAMARLKPGEMTPAIPQQGALTLYYLRDESQGKGTGKAAAMVDYAVFVPPGGTDLAALRGRLTGCDALYVAARGLAAPSLQRQTSPEASLPPALRAAMAGLDAGESAVLTGTSGAAELVMLCARTPQTIVTPSRDDVRSELVNQRVTLLANAYLEELRSNAIIVDQ